MSTNFTKKDTYHFNGAGNAYPTVPSLQFKMNDNGLISGKVINYGREEYYPVALSGSDLFFKVQDSADGVAWANVAFNGVTDFQVKPKGEVNFFGPLRLFWRVLAYGNADGEMEVGIDETLDLVKI